MIFPNVALAVEGALAQPAATGSGGEAKSTMPKVDATLHNFARFVFGLPCGAAAHY